MNKKELVFTGVILPLMAAYVCIYLNLQGRVCVCVCAWVCWVKEGWGENSSSNIAHSMPGACCQPKQKGNVSILCAGRQGRGSWQIPVIVAFCLRVHNLVFLHRV